MLWGRGRLFKWEKGFCWHTLFLRLRIEDEELRKKMAKNAYESAMMNHTWHKRAQELLEIAEVV